MAAIRGDLTQALRGYRDLLAQAPTPELAAHVGDLLFRRGDLEGASSRGPTPNAWNAKGGRTRRRSRGRWRGCSPSGISSPGKRCGWRVRRRPGGTTSSPTTRSAWALYRTGAFDQAWAASERARRTGTRDRRILYHAAAIAAARGDRASARRLAVRALEGHPEFDVIAAPAAKALLATMTAIRITMARCHDGRSDNALAPSPTRLRDCVGSRRSLATPAPASRLRARVGTTRCPDSSRASAISPMASRRTEAGARNRHGRPSTRASVRENSSLVTGTGAVALTGPARWDGPAGSGSARSSRRGGSTASTACPIRAARPRPTEMAAASPSGRRHRARAPARSAPARPACLPIRLPARCAPIRAPGVPRKSSDAPSVSVTGLSPCGP